MGIVLYQHNVLSRLVILTMLILLIYKPGIFFIFLSQLLYLMMLVGVLRRLMWSRRERGDRPRRKSAAFSLLILATREWQGDLGQ